MDSQIRTDGLYFLKRNSLFGPLGDDVLTEVVNSLKLLQVEKGSTVLRADEPGDSLFLIRNGRVRIVSRGAGADKDKAVAYLGRGDAVGELSLLTGETQAFSVVADTPCEFLTLSKADFDKILEAHPLVGIHLSRALSKRLAVSFNPPVDKPKSPVLVTLVPALPYEASLLFTINLSIALVEQTRRRVLVLDASPRSGDMARALGLPAPPAQEALFREEELLDLKILQKLVSIHPSGLEFLSLPPRLLKETLFNAVPPFLSLLRDHYDFILAIGPTEKDPLSQTLLQESDKIFLITWDQTNDLVPPVRDAMQENIKGPSVQAQTITLMHPSITTSSEPADFRVPWSELYHQPFRESGSPYLPQAEAKTTIIALERIARTLGKLRVGLAMGSGAAYGYTLIGILKVFEREGIPIDLAAGTSMGALLGSFYCAGKTPAEIQDISRGITKHWLRQNMFGDLTFPHGGFLAGQTLNAFLRSVLGNIEFSQLVLPFAAVATDIRTGKEVVLKEGRVAEAVRASTSLPIIFKPYLHKGQYLVDGGLINPVPTSVVANMGADVLISINLTAKPSLRRGIAQKQLFPLAPRSPGMSEVFFKMLYTMQYEIAQARTEIAHVVIAPDLRDFMWTEFHRSDDILKVGEAAAEEAVAKVKSLLPFFADYCRVPLGISLRAY